MIHQWSDIVRQVVSIDQKNREATGRITNRIPMLLEWSVAGADVAAVHDIIEATRSRRFVVRRIQDNVSGPTPTFSRDEFWRVMVGCLLTTQQRSGPDSSVSRFLRRTPFQPALADSMPQTELVLRDALSAFGGIRRAPTIAKHAAANLMRLERGEWPRIEEEFENLLVQRRRNSRLEDTVHEREAAALLSSFQGFGPKQSRNLWQWLGLTRFEIPLDSRVTTWLNQNHVFPIKLSAIALADEHFYEFVMTGVHKLCVAADVLPCVFDAAVFASYDRDWESDDLDY